MNTIRCIRTLLCLVFSMLLGGCGYIMSNMGAGSTNCIYSGVRKDFSFMTDFEEIKDSYGTIIPLAIIDIPLSFIFDTLSLPNSEHSLCPLIEIPAEPPKDEDLTLELNIPANTNSLITANYSFSGSCTPPSHINNPAPSKEFFTGHHDQPYSGKFKIPIQTNIDKCLLKIDYLSIVFKSDWNTPLTFYDAHRGASIGFAFFDGPTSIQDPLIYASKPTVNFMCERTFGLNNEPHAELGKKLLCKRVETGDKHLRPSEGILRRRTISEKTLQVNVEYSKEATPDSKTAWTKSKSGWRPCYSDNGSTFCTEKSKLTDFKMDGRTCTVYPSCTETESRL